MSGQTAGAEDPFHVSIREAGKETYEISARFRTDVPARSVWKVLTDYGRIDEFVSSVQLSNVHERNSEYLLLEQRGFYKAFFYKRNFYVLLRIRESPFKKIEFEDISKKDFSVYRGEWEIEPDGNSAAIRYKLTVGVGSQTPKFIIKMFIRNDARRFLEDLMSEIKKN